MLQNKIFFKLFLDDIFIIHTFLYMICINLYEKFICSASPSVYFYSLWHTICCFSSFVILLSYCFIYCSNMQKLIWFFRFFLQYFFYISLSWNLWLLSSLKYCKLLYIKVTSLYISHHISLSITFSLATRMWTIEWRGETLRLIF